MLLLTKRSQKKLKRKKEKNTQRTSLVVRWLRISLPTQGTRVCSLAGEDSTSRRTTTPVCHNH